MKKVVALVVFFAMVLGCFAFNVAAEEAGTYDDPLAASNFYGMYLMNNTLEAGDSDGIWYSFSASKAGIISVENSVQDQDGNKIYNYQLTVEVNGKTFYANDAVFSNPVSTFRISKGAVVKVGIRMLPDSDGNIPYGKAYVSATIVAGNESDPVKVKSPEGFVAPIGANRTISYLDGSTAGVYTGKGVVLEGDKEVISKVTVLYGSTEYTDIDGDGKIEFSFPKAADGAMIAPHYAFSIINESAKDAILVFRLTDSAAEGNFEPSTGHAVVHVAAVEPTCTEAGMNEYWYCSSCDKKYTDETCATLSTDESLRIPAKGHTFEDGACIDCGEPELTYTLGDITADGIVNGKDSNALKVILSGAGIPSDTEKQAADVNSDGDLNGKDSNLLAQFISGAVTGF